MIQVFLKDTIGQVTNAISDISALAEALNDPAILNQASIIGLLDYIARNHFHTKIGGVPYYQSNVSTWQGTYMAGDVHGRGRTWQGTGTWHEQVKRLGENRFFSGAFGVFFTFVLFFVSFVWW